MKVLLSFIFVAVLISEPLLCLSEQQATSGEIADIYAVCILEPDEASFDELIISEHYVFINAFDWNTMYKVVDYTYEIVDGELRITFFHQLIDYGRMIVHNDDWFVICVGEGEFDRLSIYGQASKKVLYENGEISSCVRHRLWYQDYHKDTHRYR